jgi:hypothetical protein
MIWHGMENDDPHSSCAHERVVTMFGPLEAPEHGILENGLT